MIAHALTIRQPALLATGQPMLLTIPAEDTDEFIRDVSREERARIRELFACFAEMIAARSLKAGAAAAAMKRAHNGWGWGNRALLKLFAAYRDGGFKPGDWQKRGARYVAGDWRILLRDYKGKSNGVLPEEFKRWLGEQWVQFKGRTDVVNATWRHVVYELWLKGAPIPGYGTIDEWCLRMGRARPHPQIVRPSELPDGWSEATFRRCLPRRKTTRAQVAHGYLAAHASQPDQILTDRSPLLPLQYVFIDDSRPDFRCTWFGPSGRGEIVYPLLVLGLDACSGVDVANCAKPRGLKSPEAENEAERRLRHGVTHDMALTVVVNTLRFGLPPWPITFVHENAAACVPSFAKHMFEEAYGDRIRFEATGIFKQRMMEHGFSEQGGAPYDKAPIEAFWRIMMTQLARLAGSTGPRYDTAPGELKQIEAYTLGLMEKAGGLAEVFARFQSPLLSFEEAHAGIEDALRILRFRTRHNLQGFDRIQEWRRSPADNYRPWAEFLALSIEEQNAIATNGDKDAILSRLESPAERFVRKLQGVELTPVDSDLLTYIQGPREQVRVLNGKITVKRIEHSDDLLIFRETDHPLLGEEYEGKTFEAAIAEDTSRIVLTDEGRILGSVNRQDRVVRGTDDWRHEAGRVASARKTDRERFAGYYLADTSTALAELRAHNAAIDPTPAIADAAQPTRLDTAASPSAAQQKRRRELARTQADIARRAINATSSLP